MFGIKILTERKLAQLLQVERDRAFTEAIEHIVTVCKQKEKIYLDKVEVRGNHNAIGFDSLFLGCDAGVTVYPNEQSD